MLKSVIIQNLKIFSFEINKGDIADQGLPSYKFSIDVFDVRPLIVFSQILLIPTIVLDFLVFN